jgi:hypothetical protein
MRRCPGRVVRVSKEVSREGRATADWLEEPRVGARRLAHCRRVAPGHTSRVTNDWVATWHLASCESIEDSFYCESPHLCLLPESNPFLELAGCAEE